MLPRVEGASRELEDPLNYLPRKGVLDYRRGQVIYDEDHPSAGLYLVVQGRVKVATTVEDGSQTVVGIHCADSFFGERAFLGNSGNPERATALEPVTLMAWSIDELEEQIERQPRLGVALTQLLVERCLDLQERLQSLALDKTSQRVELCLLRFARRFGIEQQDGSLRIPPFTHQLLSEYVGTSREIVTFQMSQLRRQGFVRYSRKGIEVFADALDEHMKKQPR